MKKLFYYKKLILFWRLYKPNLISFLCIFLDKLNYYFFYLGLGIIDFEVWRPVFRQNFGVLTRYKDYSYDIERKNHPIWPEFLIKKEVRSKNIIQIIFYY